MSIVGPNHASLLASWGAVAVETDASKPSHSPSDSTNVTTVVPKAAQRTPSTDGSASSSSAPTAGRKMTSESSPGMSAMS